MRNMSLFAVIATLLFLLSGCPSSFEDMQKQYNSNFTAAYSYVTNILPEEETIEDDSDLLPGDPGFKPSTMLNDEYYVWEDETLNLAAPFAYSYSWIVTDPSAADTTAALPIYMFGYPDRPFEKWTDKNFVITVKDNEDILVVGKTYKLSLIVTDKDGNSYADACGIVIYKHYNY